MRERDARLLGALVVAQMLGCGPEVREHAVLEPVCGHESPWRILELADDEAPLTTGSGLQRIDDRIYYIVGAVPHEDDAQLDDADFWPTPLPEHTTLWSTGPCGESPRELAHDVWSVAADERWPDLVLARTGITTGDVLAIDPEGVVPPQLFLRDVDSLDEWTDHGVVSPLPRRELEGNGTIRLSPYPTTIGDEPPTPVTLREGVRAALGATKVVGKEVMTVTAAGELVAIELGTGSETTLAVDVIAFGVSSDGRFVGSQALGAAGDPSVARPTRLLDRETGITTELGDGRGDCCGLFFGDEGMQMQLPEGGTYSQRVVLLPSLEIMDVPTPLDLVFETSDGRWFGTSAGPQLVLYDPATGDEQMLFDGWGYWRAGPTSVDVLDVHGWGGASGLRVEGPLWRADYDRDAPERLAERATTEYLLDSDGRVVTPLDVDRSYLGDLVFIDPDGLDELLMDDHVFAHLPTRFTLDPIFENDAIPYAVVDGDRSGIWLTRLPAAQ